MSFFGVLRPSDSPEFTVAKLDINLWCLPSFLYRNVFFCDAGVQLTSANAPLSTIELALPFAAPGVEDLSKRLAGKPRTAGLVFGDQVCIDPQGGKTFLAVGSQRLRLATLDCGKSSPDQTRSTPFFTLWRLVFAPVLAPGEQAYCRLRFRVKSSTSLQRVWVWRRSTWRGRSALVDIRVADVRETVALPDGSDYPDRLVEVAQLNCFVIVPASLETRRVSPELRYVRLLEGQVWEHYLGRAIDFRRTGKLLVHFWRREKVSPKQEFRGFLSLATESRRLSWSTVGAATLVCLLIVLLLANPRELQEGLGAAALKGALNLARSWWKGLTVAVIVAVVVSLSEKLPVLRLAAAWVLRSLRKFEDWVYRKRAQAPD